MKIRIAVASVSLLFLSACASTAKNENPSAAARVRDTEKSVQRTDDVIARTEKELTDFENSLAELRKDIKGSKVLRAREKFERTLEDIDLKVKQARLELRELKLANTRAWEQFRAEMNSALENYGKSLAE